MNKAKHILNDYYKHPFDVPFSIMQMLSHYSKYHRENQ